MCLARTCRKVLPQKRGCRKPASPLTRVLQEPKRPKGALGRSGPEPAMPPGLVSFCVSTFVPRPLKGSGVPLPTPRSHSWPQFQIPKWRRDWLDYLARSAWQIPEKELSEENQGLCSGIAGVCGASPTARLISRHQCGCCAHRVRQRRRVAAGKQIPSCK